MIKVEFDGNNKVAAKAFGKALLELAGLEIDPGDSAPAPAEAPAAPAPAEAPAAPAPAEAPTPAPAAPAPAEAPAAPAPALDPDKRDSKGVVFDPEYCGVSKDPFYLSGPREGQWKKKRGVGDEAYDEWYAAQIMELGGLAGAPEPPPVEVDPGAAFGGPAPADMPAEDLPTTCGEFFTWVAERQTAGLSRPDEVTAAYARTGINLPDLFPPATPEEITSRVQLLVRELLK